MSETHKGAFDWRVTKLQHEIIKTHMENVKPAGYRQESSISWTLYMQNSYIIKKIKKENERKYPLRHYVDELSSSG